VRCKAPAGARLWSETQPRISAGAVEWDSLGCFLPGETAATGLSGTVALRSAIRPPVLIVPEVFVLLANKKRASYDARQPKQPNVTSFPPEGLAGGAGW